MNKPSYTKNQIVLLIAPPILLGSTYAVYYFLARWLGPVRGYLGGFLFYWIFWCLLLPLWVVGPVRLREMFKDARPRFGKPAWLGVLFLAGPFVVPFFTLFLPGVGDANLQNILVSVLFAVINGTMEEILWRGSYVLMFPKSWLWSYWYPSIFFGYWHLSPQVIYPSQMPGGAFAFASVAIFMGLVFGWVAKKTGSIRWTTISHILTDFMGLAGFAFLGGGY
jgi:membrane protease YdiL (CAAX protease family)